MFYQVYQANLLQLAENRIPLKLS